ncbi:hypothetical protein BMF94_6417 [Rhodotorula taiwanensis]|uniref:Uncharacterized protein n=1 Tax=Rhodotorula taiwanensis TaxID=741276 RepID=A0A2S5B149_9BASI|nr:hypothetical protein BMF94_6417 [Rhodotorula taiwanensis]
MAELQELIATQLSALSLRNDDETVEFIVGLVEEESFEPEDRRSAILGMLEADEDDDTTTSSVDKLLEEASAHQEKVLAERRAEEEAAAAAAAAAAGGKYTKPEGKKLSPADEAKRKADLLKQYGYLEEETEADRIAREESERAPEKALKDPSQMSKKQRKKAFEGVDLLALPNMNKAHVDAADKQRRAASASAAQAKKARDEADRKKQKDDEKRKLEEKRKKAAKVERKA